jgi:hypothetical protein
MRAIYSLVMGGLLLCALSSCQKSDGNNVFPNASKLILGKWNLQQQKSIIYADNVKQTDTVYTASASNVAAAWFNANGTFSTSGYYILPTNTTQPLTGGLISAKDSTFGTYKIVGSSLNTNVGIAGFANIIGFYDVASYSGVVAPVNLVSRSLQISQLSSTKLNLHFESVYNTTVNDITTNYKEEEDYYYTK